MLINLDAIFYLLHRFHASPILFEIKKNGILDLVYSSYTFTRRKKWIVRHPSSVLSTSVFRWLNQRITHLIKACSPTVALVYNWKLNLQSMFNTERSLKQNFKGTQGRYRFSGFMDCTTEKENICCMVYKTDNASSHTHFSLILFGVFV